MLYIVRPPGLVYTGETDEQAREIDRQIAEHNRRVDEELEKWGPWPMKALWPWCREHAPHLLPPSERQRLELNQ